MRSRVIGMLTGMLILPAVLAGQEEAKLQRVRESYPSQEAERIERLVGDARAEGLPAGPILDKALEGVAKSVEAPEVVAALTAYTGRLRQARLLLGDTPRPGTVVAAADALQRGAPPEAVGSVGREAGPRGSVALVVLGDLVEAGVPADRALELVRETLSRHPGDRALLSVPAEVRRLMREGRRPEAAVRAAARTIRTGRPPVPPGSRDPDRRPPPDRPPPDPDGGGLDSTRP